jgi:hypothetical protein
MICFHLTDNDECQLGTHNCHQYASCQNTHGLFGCSCNEGYSGNGTTCEGRLSFYLRINVARKENNVWNIK